MYRDAVLWRLLRRILLTAFYGTIRTLRYGNSNAVNPHYRRMTPPLLYEEQDARETVRYRNTIITSRVALQLAIVLIYFGDIYKEETSRLNQKRILRNGSSSIVNFLALLLYDLSQMSIIWKLIVIE